jgi:hypothetical protein
MLLRKQRAAQKATMELNFRKKQNRRFFYLTPCPANRTRCCAKVGIAGACGAVASDVCAKVIRCPDHETAGPFFVGLP